MGKLRIARKATKGKGKKWKKGGSSSSNPEHKQYRNSAKSGFFNRQKDSVNLTQDLLAKHDAIQGRSRTNSQSSDISDDQSIGARTFDTFASGFSNCSNSSFNRLMKNWQSSSALHKEMLAVLAAITEVIKDKGGKETETEYFAALMLTLETVDNDDARVATISLLGMVMKRLPASILKVKFSDVSKVFVQFLGQFANSNHIAILRSLIGCLSVLLRAQETAVWRNSSTLHIYNIVLSFTTHAKPKVRKAAQHAVCSILKGSNLSVDTQGTSNLHPAVPATAKFCIQKIEETGGSGQATTTLHILGLLKEILGCFSKSEMKAVCETLLRLMLLSSPLVKCCTLRTIEGLFRNKPKHMSQELAARMINALYDHQPNSNDNQSLVSWLNTMHEALLYLQSLNSQLCLDHTVKFFSSAVNCWLSDRNDVIDCVTSILKSLLLQCIVPCADSMGQSLVTCGDSVTSAHKLVQCLEGALKYQFHSVWNSVLKVLTVLFQAIGKPCRSVLKKCVQLIADLRDTHHFAFTSDLDRAMGAAVQHMEPETILQAVPIQINEAGDKFDFPRSWLIPVIRDNVKETKLQFFIQFFLPLANQLRNKVLDLEKQGRKIEAKTFDILQSQIWSMLPGFCNKPTDLTESFKGIARTMGVVLTERADLRLFIMSALRTLINKNGGHAENKQELSRFGKNFLPILFNLYTSEPETSSDNSIRLAVYDTIKVYLKITDPNLSSELFEKAVSRLDDSSVTSFNRHAIIDLSRALLPYTNEEQVMKVYTYCKSLLENEDRTLQKKAYRVLEEICQSESTHCIQLVTENISELQDLLLSTINKTNPSSTPPRLRCLTYIVRQLADPNPDFISKLIPEAVLCVKVSAEKARTAAFNLLIEIARAKQRWSGNPKDATCDFISQVMGGLVGTPHVMSATLVVLGRLFYEFNDLITAELSEMVINNVCMLLEAKCREIVQSALAFIKTLFDTMSTDDLIQYVPAIVQGITCSGDDSQRHFRFNVKLLLVRLVRKFGFETISKMIPKSHQKVLSNIRKTEARKVRNKTRGDDDESQDEKSKKPTENIDEVLQDSDDSEMSKPEETNHPKKRRTRTKAPAYIEEAGEEIVDFLDHKVSQKISAVRPSQRSSQGKIKHSFKTASDGRLIITEEDEEKVPKKQEDSMDYLIEAAEFAKKGQKRKRNDDSDNEEVTEHPGDRRGIHRKNPKNPQDGTSYRAEKGKGDIKKKGKHEPYAYIPLDPQALNKRKKAKYVKQFANVVRGAKKGAAKGSKTRMKGKRS